MTPSSHQPNADTRTPFEKFRDLARAIVTTPKPTHAKISSKPKTKKKRK